MASYATIPTSPNPRSSESASITLRRAWVIWFALLISPFLMFLLTVWRLKDEEDSNAMSALSRAWFLGSMTYLAVVIPAAFYWRSRIFKEYWFGQVVTPRDYLKGMLVVWLALETGGLVGLLGCLFSGKLLPCMLPTLVAFILFFSLWPSGRAMTQPVGNEDDAELYQDPR